MGNIFHGIGYIYDGLMYGMISRVRVKGSGGYILADLYDEEVGRARLAGELFIGALGRVDEARIISYYCNSCGKEFKGSPMIRSSDAGEEVAKGHLLLEQGEYVCRECNGTIARYKVFSRVSKGSTPTAMSGADMVEHESLHDEAGRVGRKSIESNEGISLRRLVEESASVVYKGNRIGVIKDIVVIMDGKISLLIERSNGKDGNDDECNDSDLLLPWELVESIEYGTVKVKGKTCSKCGYENSILDTYCAECGNRL